MSTSAARRFIEGHVNDVRPLEVSASKAWWDASVTGSDESFAQKTAIQNQLDAYLSQPAKYEEITAIREAIKKGASTDDDITKRQIDLLHSAFLEKHVPPAQLQRMVDLSNQVEKIFNTFRAHVDGKELTQNEVNKILKESKDLDLRRKAWEGSKAVGGAISPLVSELVEIRNNVAKELGFAHFHDMMLFLNEQTYDNLIKTFDDLDTMTRQPFEELKARIDASIVSSLGLASAKDIRPWHYQDVFFQESPKLGNYDLDKLFASQDLIQLCSDFYKGINLPIDDVIARSSLLEQKGKSPHAFCIDVDREGDVRVLCNIVPNAYWMDTCLHELGHSVYSSKNMSQELPYLLRRESHILSTEGIAMLFGRLSKTVAWIDGMGLAPSDSAERASLKETCELALKGHLLVFSRWCQVMLRFERAMYAQPDQDLNKLWWDLVEKYQGLTRPEGRNEPDYASKIHIVLAPVYYHNYLMGEMFASQLLATIRRECYPGGKPAPPGPLGLVSNPHVGTFLKEKVFAVGNRFAYDDLTKFATGEYLTPKYFADDFK